MILVNGQWRNGWLLRAVGRRLREELAKLDLRLNEAKSRVVDLTQGEAFGFLGFIFRRLRSPRGRWWVQKLPAMKQRTALLRKLKEEFDGELQVPGSHRLVQELIESDLVDQINLMVFPVLLGTGKKAFEEKSERRNLRLKESKVVGDGVVVLIYERAA